MIPPGVRVIFFDAVGTLLFPEPSAVAVYSAVGLRYGSVRSKVEIADRFSKEFRQQEELDRQRQWVTDEQCEEQRWRQIVRSVLDDVQDSEQCFRELWQHFARPEAWRSLTGAGEVMRELGKRGFRLGMASNYDRRLRSVVAGLPDLSVIEFFVISSEVGFRKPTREFFDAAARAAGVASNEVLFVGDDPTNDYEGARNAGMQALLFEPDGRSRGSIRTLAELLR